MVLNWLLALLSAALLDPHFPRFSIVWFAPVALAPSAGRAWRANRGPAAASCSAGPPASSTGSASATGSSSCWLSTAAWAGGADGALFLLFCFAKALHLAVFAMLAGRCSCALVGGPRRRRAVGGHRVTHGSLGFAWLALGNAGIDMAVPVRLAPYAGVYGISFLVRADRPAWRIAILRRSREWALWLALVLPLPLLPRLPANPQPTETAAVLQPEHPETRSGPTGWRARSHERSPVAIARTALKRRAAPPKSSGPKSRAALLLQGRPISRACDTASRTRRRRTSCSVWWRTRRPARRSIRP